MTASEYRKLAWSKLKGKKGTYALITLIYVLITGLASSFGFGIVELLIFGPFELGLAAIALKVVEKQDIKIEDMFSGFKDFVKSFVLGILIFIFVFLWSLLLIVPGIIMAFAYSMSFFIMKENPELSANEARKKSIELMRGNKWKYFCLMFSFIGWILLSILTFGILLLWVVPCMQTASAEFYKNLIADKK